MPYDVLLMGLPHPLLTHAKLGPTLARKLCVLALEVQHCCTVFPQEFEIELEGSQSLRILCYEKCYDKTKVNKDNNEIVDKIMGKGQIQVRVQMQLGHQGRLLGSARRWCLLGKSPSHLPSWLRCLVFCDLSSKLV